MKNRKSFFMAKLNASFKDVLYWTIFFAVKKASFPGKTIYKEEFGEQKKIEKFL